MSSTGPGRVGMPAGVADGIRQAARLAVTRPPRLGAVRLVAVDGPSGSGKTSLAAPLAAAIARELGGRVVRPTRSADRGPADGSSPLPGVASACGSAAEYPSPAAECAVQCPAPTVPGPLVSTVSTDLLATWEQPLGWWPVLERHLLAPLAGGRPAELPVVQWVSGNPRPGGSVHVPLVDVLVLEGVSAGRRAVTDRLTVLVWVEVPDRAERLERAVARDGAGTRPFLARWQDDEDAHFSADRTRDRADVVVTAP